MGRVVFFPEITRTEPVHKYDDPAPVIILPVIYREPKLHPKKKESLALPAPQGGTPCGR